jgi:hypothetical protein
MTRFAPVLGLTLLIAGCPADDNDQDAAAQCTCQPETALQTSYDNASSGLGAENVQDALDELADRPIAELPIGGRLQMIQQTLPNDGSVRPQPELDCPDMEHDIALSGTCGAVEGATLRGSGLLNGATVASFFCSYEQPAGNTDDILVTILCLRNAR